jgi:hypothetical protein
MDEALHTSRKTLIEAAAVLVIYILFLGVGVGSGQMTMTVDSLGPPDGASLRRSPVQLDTRIAVRGVPLPNVTVSYTVLFWGGARQDFDMTNDADGIARLLLPVSTGNYTWHATATRRGYPTIVSRSNTFSVNLTLTVEPLSPSTNLLAISPVHFKARVTDMKGHKVESANVTFYADMVNIGSNATGANGIAELSQPLASGMHTWFASASKDDDGGISGPTMFLVGELASFQNEDSESLQRSISQLARGHHSSNHESMPNYLSATVILSEFDEYVADESRSRVHS